MTGTQVDTGLQGDLVAVVLRPSKRKWLTVFAGCLGFTVIGVFLCRDADPSDHWAGWLSIVFFGGGGLLILPQIFSSRAHLRLNEDGFSFATLRRRSEYRWSEIIAPFAAMRIARNDVVMFRTNRAPTRTSRLNQGFCGYDYGLPDTYGMKAEELAALLTNFWWRATLQ